MTHQELFKAVEAELIGNVYFFYGEEEYVKESAIDKLRKKLLPEGLEMLNESILDTPVAESIIATAETLPMMCDKRLIIVKNYPCLTSGVARDEAAEVERLTQYLPNSPNSACIVFYVQGKPDERKKFVKFLQKNAVSISFAPLNENDLIKWMVRQLNDYDKTITHEDAQYLIFKTGQSLTLINQEVNKLLSHVGENKTITKKNIDDIVTPSLECTVFELIDKIIENKPEAAMIMLQSMLEAGESYISLIAMITRQVRFMMHVRIMQEDKINNAEIEKRLELTRFVAGKIMRQAQKFSVSRLNMLFDQCIEADYGIKSGRIRDDIAIKRLILLLFHSFTK